MLSDSRTRTDGERGGVPSSPRARGSSGRAGALTCPAAWGSRRLLQGPREARTLVEVKCGRPGEGRTHMGPAPRRGAFGLGRSRREPRDPLGTGSGPRARSLQNGGGESARAPGTRFRAGPRARTESGRGRAPGAGPSEAARSRGYRLGSGPRLWNVAASGAIFPETSPRSSWLC